MNSFKEPGFVRAWLKPIAAIVLIAFGLFFMAYWLDGLLANVAVENTSRVISYWLFDPASLTDAVVGLGAMTAGAMAIVVTVVSIVLQLSANRYSGVTSMFFRDRTNTRVFAYYVITCCCAVWVSLSLKSDFAPRATLTLLTIAVVISLAIMGPYFAYVFRFLQPRNIVRRIQHEALSAITQGAIQQERPCDKVQVEVLDAMEELADITSGSIGCKDKIIASQCVNALKELAVQYVPLKTKARTQWFNVGDGIRTNPDFVAMDADSIQQLEANKTWFEWKIMRQYIGIFNDALGPMRDINYLIAIDTRYILQTAAQACDLNLVILCIRFMNSYLRATLNARDVRTAYNILNQYRLAIEFLIRINDQQTAVKATRYLAYYAHISYDKNLPFVTETIAYDVAALCQLAGDLEKTDLETKLLTILLDLDRPTEEGAQEKGLRGVRKAQSKLASYYLSIENRTNATRIYEDMKHEPMVRLQGIRNELIKVDSKNFWEIIDRGNNFEYVPPHQRQALTEFFSWFGLETEPPRESIVLPMMVPSDQAPAASESDRSDSVS